MVKLWAKKGMMKRHSGFSKDYTVSKNLEVMAKNTNLKRPANVWLRVGKQASILVNLSQDKKTVRIATLVKNAAFKKLEKIHSMEK